MKKTLLFSTILTLLCTGKQIQAQQRYLNDVFSSVTVTNDITYGQNKTVISGSPVLTDLKMDVYEPSGDTASVRPLVLVLHTGSFLPAVMNGQPTGGRKDSAVVEMCTRFAKKGYVAAAVSYRLGWNPLSSQQEVRTGTLINAAYRGVQDAHTCVRYFNMEAVTNGNPFKIDTNNVVVGGLGTGGYLALGYAYFDKYTELNMSKFIDFSQNPPKPYIDTALSGDFQGLLTRPLNNSNHVGYSSKVKMVFNAGGALGDSSWLEAGNVPVVAFHCTKDPNAPYTTGAVIVPTTGDFVLEASGSYDVLRRANNSAFGDINSPIKAGFYNDVYTTRANQINDGYEGLFPFVTPAPQPAINCNGILLPGQEQGSPWDWWNEAWYKAAAQSLGQNGDTMACNAKRGNPDMSPTKGRTYIDTIQGYLAPRMVNVLGLPGNNVGLDDVNEKHAVKLYPNPSNDYITIETSGSRISNIELYSVAGQLIYSETLNNEVVYTLSKDNLKTGLYFIKVYTPNSTSIHKLIFN